VDEVAPSPLPTASVPAEEQLRHAQEFLTGLISQLGVAATVTSHPVNDDTVEFLIQGDDIGALIGPRGTTLLALQELTRTVAQRRAGFNSLRILVDVNGYRRRRQEALARFAEKVAAEVRATNSSRALEPMTAADRKIVHDAVNPIAGVTTISEGEEPYRKVVLLPAPAPEGAPEGPEAKDAAEVPRPKRARAKKAEASSPPSGAGLAGDDGD
jgi:spoIIIJ-associated protein